MQGLTKSLRVGIGTGLVTLSLTFLYAQEVLSDSDGDRIPDSLETLAGLDPQTDECADIGRCKSALTKHYIVLMLDQSETMLEEFGSGNRMDATRQTTVRMIRNLPSQTGFGLYRYGPRKCDGMEQIQIPRANVNQKELIAKVETMEPVGNTPIAASLEQLKTALADQPGFYQVIMITDGRESCGGNTTQAARELISDSTPKHRISLEVIGLDLKPKVQRFYEKLARESKSQFRNVKDEKELNLTIGEAMDRIIANHKEIICLQNQLDEVIQCEKRKLNRVDMAFNKLNSPLIKLPEDQKRSLINSKGAIAKQMQAHIEHYRQLRNERRPELVQEIYEFAEAFRMSNNER